MISFTAPVLEYPTVVLLCFPTNNRVHATLIVCCLAEANADFPVQIAVDLVL